MLIRPGERLAADGVIDDGHRHVDESLLTGESLPRAGIHQSWSGLRSTLSIQRRVSASMRRKDGTVHVRKSTVAEPALASIYKALGITAAAGGTRKLIS